MTNEIKFTQEELTQISNIQTEYQALGVQMVQTTLAIENTKKYLDGLEAQSKELAESAIAVSEKEKVLSQELEAKYGKGEINMETGVFTPVG
jgi:hypothetical protein